MKFLKTTGAMLVASTALCCAASANADDGLADGWYVSGNAGVTALRDSDTIERFDDGSIRGTADFDTGYGLSGAIGKSFDAFRVEGEVSYRHNDIGTLSDLSVSIPGLFSGPLEGVEEDVDGDVTSFGFMGNAYYDIKNTSKMTPFLMAGLGVAHINLDVKKLRVSSSTLGSEFDSQEVVVDYDESDTVFAYQMGAGVGYAAAPNTDVTLSYRYFATADPTFDDGDDKIKGEYGSHNVWVGLTHRF